ncbi:MULTISPECIES: hypothetical protein [Burkholderia]|uniref:hypothetical protein n=1 Tax=Burkholderia TaxID=32008 RepID=UPI000B7AA173|nr:MULTISPECIES: hypothetical protein [Burkholderia]MBY4725727.1 hypothetical protein [Burkholderia contaminans]MCI3969265.1 hypothetical protein [Burkholderia sp. HI4860]OXI98499.1 hypothetical protein CFB48_24175 [Burkholderia sp. AU33647]
MKNHKFEASVILIGLLMAILGISGYVTNVIWAFKHMSAGITLETLVAFVGLLVAPLGILHGVYTWF